MCPGYNPMPPGDDCLTLQLHGDLGAVTLRVPPGHAGGAADEGSLRGAVQARRVAHKVRRGLRESELF